jgi:hypothetical protein
MVRIGTAHFKDIRAARMAYGDQPENAFKEGRVIIGKPPMGPRQKLVLDLWGRYFIEEEL